MYFYMTDANGLYFWGYKIGFGMGNLRMVKAFWGRQVEFFCDSANSILRGMMPNHFENQHIRY